MSRISESTQRAGYNRGDRSSRQRRTFGRKVGLLSVSLASATALLWATTRPGRSADTVRASASDRIPSPASESYRAADAPDRSGASVHEREPRVATTRSAGGESARALTTMPVRGLLVSDTVADLSGIPVFLHGGGGEPLATTCSGEGEFRFDAPEGGSFTLRVGAEDASWVGDIDLATVSGQVRIELPPLGEIAVSVLDPLGTPVPDIEVRSEGKGGRRAHVADAFGEARFVLPPGAHRFYSSDPLLGRGNAAIDVEAGSRLAVEVHLKRGLAVADGTILIPRRAE